MSEYGFLKALASVSDRVGDVANAHQKLTSAVQSADEHLVDLSNDLADIRTEVADVAAAVRELADAIHTQQPLSRRWLSRAGGAR